jgi:UDP-N-acetylmuramate dehydrogenase
VTVRLADLTTLRLGGPAAAYVRAETEQALVDAVRDADARGARVLILGGGSNLVVADDGFDGTVVHVATRGIAHRDRDTGAVEVEVEAQAGEPWDPFVAHAVQHGLAGVEALSGIPGATGATPIQNVGAYGQEVADTITAVRVLDRATGEVRTLAPGDCGFGYRTSVFKRTPDRHVVLAVTFGLRRSEQSAPVRYAELARRLGVQPGDAAPLADVRDAVLELRRGKGMVVDPDDPDTRSAGSFFTNPILPPAEFDALVERVHAELGPEVRPPAWPEPDGRVKTSAAWLIERAGFHKGHGDPQTVAISGKHTLALTNRGRGTTKALIELAREVADGVEERFGVALHPEPVFVGHGWIQARGLTSR